MQVLLPQIGGSMAVLAALDLETYRLLEPWADELDALDGDVARLLHGQITDQTKADLAAFHEQSASFYKRLATGLGSVLELVGGSTGQPLGGNRKT